MNPIGIMQGRLSPQYGDRIQSFPVATWRQEFDFASRAGLDCIEWIFDTGTEAHNPLSSDDGLAAMVAAAQGSGVGIWSVCADYYMVHRLIDDAGQPCSGPVDHLRWLLGRARRLGARYIVLPFVDSSSLGSADQLSGLSDLLRAVAIDAAETGVELHLETDLPPEAVAKLVDDIGHRRVRANLDIGNSASLGHDPAAELLVLGDRIASVHIKDRVFGGTTVPLGTGDADFPATFGMLARIGYRGPLILQAARVDGIAEIDLAVANRKFVERCWTAAAAAAAQP